jgi:hypothetical protein
MASTPDFLAVARDPDWLAHRYDPGHDAIHLVRLERARHAGLTFISDEHLPADLPRLVLRREELLAAMGPPAPLHFVFHSAYCCSTLVARAFDLPGTAMGLKEPHLLHDVVGWRWRGGDPARVGLVLDGALRLLARPFGPGEAVVAKPSNLLNGLADAMLRLQPRAGALLLHAPLPGFLVSIAKKGMWGRLWVRELFLGLMKDGAGARLGFTPEQLMGQSDLQIAAAGWLAQQALFADLALRHGARVRTLDSDTLLARPAEAMAALGRLYRLDLDGGAIAAGPAFTRHSKSGARFGAEARAAEQQDAGTIHRDEIEKVCAWATAVADTARIPMTLPAPLLG